MKFKLSLVGLLLLLGIMLTGCFMDREASQSKPVKEKKTSGVVVEVYNKIFDLNAPFKQEALSKLDASGLLFLKNCIYAKHGYIFSSNELGRHFSQFTWYKPVSKDVAAKLTELDQKNLKSISLWEKLLKIEVKNSRDNQNYSSGPVELSLVGRFEKVPLYITKEYIKTTNETDTNLPTRITLRVKDSPIVFESLWNDGVHIGIADFDDTDAAVDIYLTVLGTDIGCQTYIYKFDGTKLYLFDKFAHLTTDFLYDGKGNIYYWAYYPAEGADLKKINNLYNYKTKRAGRIADKNLGIRLNQAF